MTPTDGSCARWNASAYFYANRAATGSQFCSEWWQFGAPRPMKMGTIVSLWRYDAGAYHTLQPENTRTPAI
jgi:hypothetical protein